MNRFSPHSGSNTASGDERRASMRRWAREQLGQTDLDIAPASEDASFRRYWRASAGGRSWIIMDAPPEHEDCRPFVDVSARITGVGLGAPEVLAADLDRGFLLLTDLGAVQYLTALTPDNADLLYQQAMDALLTMQRDIDPAGLPAYDHERLMAEMGLFPEWLLRRHLDLELSPADQRCLNDTMEQLAASALEQPRSFVHLDYHSRNLMLRDNGGLGILDFQDARHGPVTYDLVSLLRDCYVRWPDERVDHWSEQHRQALDRAGVASLDAAVWRRWFDWMGMQRHLKAAGIFARLNLRDGKPWFLKDVPRTVGYIGDVAARYPELAAFASLVNERVLPRLESTGPGDG